MSDEQTEPRRCPGNGAESCGVPESLVLPSGFCLGHDPARGADRTVVGTIGGLKAGARRRRGIDEKELGALETPEDAKRMTATIALAVASGRLSSAQGRTVLVAITAWLRAHEQGELEELQRRLKEQG